MITILFGENSAESRNKYVSLRNEYTANNYEIIELTADILPELDKWLFDTQLLFAPKRAFFGQNLLSKKEQREILKKYDTLKTEAHFILWEESIDDKTAKYAFTTAKLVPFKFPQNIFQLLDGLYPGNKQASLTLLSSVVNSVDENIIYFMIVKRIRELLLLKEGQEIPKLAGWQKSRLSNQAQKWPLEKLCNFYDALYRIEVLNKTSGTPYQLKKALDILIIYSL